MVKSRQFIKTLYITMKDHHFDGTDTTESDDTSIGHHSQLIALSKYATDPSVLVKKLKLCKNVGEIKLFSETGPNESVRIDMLGELFGTPRGHRYLSVITDILKKHISQQHTTHKQMAKWKYSTG